MKTIEIFLQTRSGRKFQTEADWKNYIRVHLRKGLPPVDLIEAEADLLSRAAMPGWQEQYKTIDGRLTETDGEYSARLSRWKRHTENLLLYLRGQAEIVQVN